MPLGAERIVFAWCGCSDTLTHEQWRFYIHFLLRTLHVQTLAFYSLEARRCRQTAKPPSCDTSTSTRTRRMTASWSQTNECGLGIRVRQLHPRQLRTGRRTVWHPTVQQFTFYSELCMCRHWPSRGRHAKPQCRPFRKTSRQNNC